MVRMSNKLRWGVLSTAAIGTKQVLPAMMRCQYATISAVASRDLAKARKAAGELGIPTAYGSYEELLADPKIDVIYNPLPNQPHIPWTIKAAEAGKHVLCENLSASPWPRPKRCSPSAPAPGSKSAKLS